MNPSTMIDAWYAEQVSNSKKIIKTDDFSSPINFIGGLDISFRDQSEGIELFEAVAALVVIDYSTLEIVYEDHIKLTTEIPYISGYLGYREAPFAEELYRRLLEKAPNFVPQIILVDGCGIYHPRRFGSASQIGLSLNICTIGISKSFLKIDGELDEEEERQFILDDLKRARSKNLIIPVMLKPGEIVANALYNGLSKKPSCFVSIGHKISLQTATEIVQRVSIHKVPEPIRRADLLSRQIVFTK